MKTFHRTLLVSLIFSIEIFAQSFSLGLGTGVSFLQGNNFYSNELGLPGIYKINGSTANFTGMNFNSEFNLNGNISYTFQEFPLSIYSNISYLILRGTGNAALSPDATKSTDTENFNIVTKMNIFSIGFGGKYLFTNWSVKPIFLVEGNFNNFSDISIYAKNANREFNFFSTEGINRIGASVGTGFNYNLFSQIDFELLIKYSAYNFA